MLPLNTKTRMKNTGEKKKFLSVLSVLVLVSFYNIAQRWWVSITPFKVLLSIEHP